jgi:hypothetical protein
MLSLDLELATSTYSTVESASIGMVHSNELFLFRGSKKENY